MGKRKHREEDEDYLERKIRRLERKKSKIRRRRRHRSYSPSTSSYTDNEYDCMDQDVVEPDLLPEDWQYEESPLINNTVYDITEDEVGPLTSGGLLAAGGLRSVVVQNGNGAAAAAGPRAVDAPPPALSSAAAPAAASTPAPAAASTSSATPAPALTTAIARASDETIDVQESAPTVTALDPDLLCLLGDEPVKEETFGPCIHDNISTRWSDILVNGMKDDIKNDILKRFEIPENLKLARAPTINPEIKAACNDNVLRRDIILSDKQKFLATIITGVANTLSTLLTTDSTLDKHAIIKSLSDTGRLLCHLHFSETQTRRNFLIPSLNKEVKDNIKDLKRDNLLFGKDLQESLKSIKAMSKTGAELRPTVPKPKWTPKHQQAGPSTPKSLNWRGQPSSAVRGPPRQPPARTSSTRGGRRPPPPPPSRRASDRRAPRPHGRASRR